MISSITTIVTIILAIAIAWIIQNKHQNSNNNNSNGNHDVTTNTNIFTTPDGKKANFQIIKKSKGSLYQALIHGQTIDLKNQFGLNGNNVKQFLSKSCKYLNKEIIIKNLHAFQFLNKETQDILLNNRNNICQYPSILFSVLLNTNICIFITNNDDKEQWKCYFNDYKPTHRNIFILNNTNEFNGLLLIKNNNITDMKRFHLKRENWRRKKKKKEKKKKKNNKKQSIAETFAKKNTPHIFYKTDFETWKARKEPWDGIYFKKKIMESLTGIYMKVNNPHFGPYFDPARPYNRLQQVKPKHAYVDNHTMPMSTFINHVQSDDDILSTDTADEKTKSHHHHHYYYLSKEIDNIDKSLIQDIYPYHELLRLNPQKTSINCWIGQSGVVTPCHYDGYHNIYVQLSGYKMFYLAPPTLRNFVKPYPFLHPSQGQCQIDNYMFADDNPTIALLKPGDVLYIPPLWFHSVVSISPSYSVNAWTEDVNVAHVNEIFHTKLPYILRNSKENNNKELQEENENVLNILMVIYKITYLIFEKDDSTTLMYFKQLNNRRYDALIENQELPNIEIPHNNKDWLINICSKGNLNQYHIFQIRDVQNYVKTIVNKFMSDKISSVTRETWLSNYVEYVLINSLGMEYLKYIPRLISIDMVRCGEKLF